MRIKFKKDKQRMFLRKAMINSDCPSLKELASRLDISYSTLKNYFNEDRCLTIDLFDDLCLLANIKKEGLNVEYLKDNWGQVKGGKKSKRKSFT